MLLPHHIELLAPAKTAEIGREAILHGADAVYIGGPSFGARHNASNSLDDIAQLVEFAHRYHAKIFVTFNTILHDAELEPARQLIQQFYNAGVDALIVQDMAIMELDIPPIQIHASTQCDIRTPEKAAFLGDVGFSQLVLARELSLEQIKAIHAQTTTPLEYFVHGALCVAYSGQCYISHAQTGRSANRGDCSQACRLPYTLQDNQGRVVAYDKHLLSMKDNDQSANVEALLDAGIQSLKIEGRYKDMGYVKNITAHYRILLDEILERRPEWVRASSGRSTHSFIPNVDKNFHRGHTDYFANGRLDNIGAFDSPKYLGLHIGHVIDIGKDYLDMACDSEEESLAQLANGDGLNYMHKREVMGLQANVVKRLQSPSLSLSSSTWRIYPNEKMNELIGLKKGLAINRNKDHQWEQALTKKSADRVINVRMTLQNTNHGYALHLIDEDGISSITDMACEFEVAQQAEKMREQWQQNLSKCGGTEFTAQSIDIKLNPNRIGFVSAKQINQLRREALEAHRAARLQAYVRPMRTPAPNPQATYPESSLTYLANVYNHKADAFYRKHGVQLIEAAYEAHQEAGEVSLMITKHCLRFSFNLCPKQAKGVVGVQGQVKAEPMTLINGDEKLTLKFDCKPCEMHVMGSMKNHIIKTAPPVSAFAKNFQGEVKELVFHKTKPF